MDRNEIKQDLRPATHQDAGFDPTALDRVDVVMRQGLEDVFPAAVVLVARHGAVALHRAYGHLDPETHACRVQTDDLFDLASLTKLFTATAFMRLVDEGRVALDTPVADILTEFDGVRSVGPTEDPISKSPIPVDQAYAGIEVNTRQVTFWHLLTHTSGLAAWRSIFRVNGENDGDVPLPHHISDATRARRVAAIYERYDFAYPPGERSVYSDLGIILLGEAITRLSGMSLDTYIQTAVITPLGLAHTTFNPITRNIPLERIVPTEVCTWRQRRCRGEVHDENAASLGGVAGHAGLFSTAWDVAVLGQMYLNGGHYGGKRILSPTTVDEMTRTHVDFEDNPRGLGWLQRSAGWSSSGRLFGPRSYGHTGFTGTSLWVDPDRGLLVALLTNRVYYGRDPAAITNFRPRLHDAVVRAIRE